MAERTDLQAKEKQEVSAAAEQTKPDRVFTPVVDIFENEQALTVLADMPGVKPQDLTVDLNENVLTLVGDVASPENEGEVDVVREYRTGRYYRQFTISDIIDQSKIEAVLNDGVLRLTLPKAEAAKPRKIEVKAG
jgi:HSP20 family molecular chaperone IbpA